MKILILSKSSHPAALQILIILVIILLSACRVPREIREISIQMPGLESSMDGTFEGAYDSKMVKAEVVVKLKDHSIEDIKLIKHDTGFGKKSETLLDSVLLYQTIELDAISGATASSRIILKSIENAINKSIN